MIEYSIDVEIQCIKEYLIREAIRTVLEEKIMPYIDSNDREYAMTEPRTPGELNFAITMLLIGYIERKGLNYTHMNDCFGATEGAKTEFYRRVAVPYENTKISINGDVYPEKWND